jgi:transcriptional regulator with XRE-family HTH domain
VIRSDTNRKRLPYTKLKNYFSENHIPQAEVAKLLGKGVSALNQNLNGTGGDFTVTEVVLICNEYKISADVYFFTDDVSKTTTKAS